MVDNKNWTQILEQLETCPSITVSDEEKATVSSTMTRLHKSGKKEFTIKKSRLNGENIVVRIV